MKLDRSKNTARNLIFGTVAKIYGIAIPFVMRTLLIYTLGMAYTGLNSLFTSVLSVLNLAELGVGSAMTFSMYKPIAEDDTASVCALMRLYKIYYRVIGLVILIAGAAITPALPFFVKKDVPADINIYVLYAINLMTTVLTYWLFAYKNCILYAHQRNDIGNKIGLVIGTVKYGLQAVVLVAFKNYYAYIMVALLLGIVSNIVTAIVSDKLYPQYKAKGKLPKEQVQIINRRVRDLFTSRIGAIVVDSADTIVISAFLGLTALAQYQNYFFILSSVFGFVSLVTDSALAGIGNSIVTESSEKNFNDLKKFAFIISWMSSFCVCCLACMYQPFIELWVKKENLLSYGMVILFCVYFFVKQINSLLNLYKDASGIWHEDRFRPLVTAGANLVMNLIMVQFWGLYGILLSTVLSMLVVGMPWLLHNLFTTVFRSGCRELLKKLLIYGGVTAVSCVICIGISHFATFNSLILTLVLRLVICTVISNLIFFAVFFKSSEFKSAVVIADSLTKGKIKLLRKFM